ncbi:hypothetical protein BY458DRAFT_445435 [Sporodiniella umbellata]|nr:hypothetical protein BY458DRAFT_445435 [Sporodiniella umbellata]
MAKSTFLNRPFINLTLTNTFKTKTKALPKSYGCTFCFKQFNRPSALRTHSYTHTGEKPHLCDRPGCGRRFAVSSNLRRHLKVHEDRSACRLTSRDRVFRVERLMQKVECFSSEMLFPQADSFFGSGINHYNRLECLSIPYLLN